MAEEDIANGEQEEVQATPQEGGESPDGASQPPEQVEDEPMFIGEKDLDLGVVYDVPVEITVVLGEKEMYINELLELGTGSVVELERKVGEAVDIYVNKRLVARGEVVIVEDHIGVTMTEIIKKENS